MIKKLQEIYSYREMIFSLVRRDIKGRYKGSVFGFIWTFLNPLLQLLVYTFVFSIVMRFEIKDYYFFLFVALIPWMFFSVSLSGGSGCILAQQDMVKKIYFPREVLPIAYVTSQFVNMLLCFIVIFGAMIIGRYSFSLYAFLCLPLVMLVEYMLALGFVMLLSALTVYFRDIEYLMGVIMMAWQFLSPVMYSTSQAPEECMWVFKINPMTSIINAYREILYYGNPPQLSTLLFATITGVAVLVVGWKVFDILQRHFVEEM